MNARAVEIATAIGLALIGLFAFLFMCSIQEDLILKCVAASNPYCPGYFMFPLFGLGIFLIFCAPLISLFVRHSADE